MMISFFASWYRFGILRTFWSKDFIFAILITMFALFLKHYHQISIEIEYKTILSVLVGLFAFIFAALAIIVSLSDEKFLVILGKAGVFDDFLFHYWLGCSLYLVGISTIFLLYIFAIQGWGKYLALFIFFIFGIFLVRTC